LSLAGGAAKKAFAPVSGSFRHLAAGRAGKPKADLSQVHNDRFQNSPNISNLGKNRTPAAVLAHQPRKIRTNGPLSRLLTTCSKAVWPGKFSAALFSKAALHPIRINTSTAI